MNLDMNTTLESECVTIGMEFSEIINGDMLQEIDNQFLKRFNFKNHSKDDWKNGFLDACSPIDNIMTKLSRNTRSCVVFGESSVGKSSLINAILGMNLFKSGFRITSNCFVEIKQTDAEQSYIEINEEKSRLNNLLLLNDYHNERKLPDGSHIDVFINLPCLQDFVLVDTPEIYLNKVMDIGVEKYAIDADVVILVINSTSIINDTIKDFINRFKDLVSELNFFIVFDFVNIPDNCADRETSRRKFLNDAKNLLCGVLSYNNTEAEERIFFLCATEEIMFNNNVPGLFEIPKWEERHDSFTRFKETFKTKMMENSLDRKRRYVKELQSQISKCLGEYENAVKSIQNQIEQIKNEFGKITNLNEEINFNVEKIFENTTSEFIKRARQIITGRKKNEQEQERRRRQENELSIFLKELIDGNIQKFKNAIKDIIYQRWEWNSDVNPIEIVENIYFPLYVDNYETPECFLDNILEIKATMKRLTNAACVLRVLSIPTLVPFLIVATITGPRAVRAGIIQSIDKTLQFVCAKDVEPIQSFIDSVKDDLVTSHAKFMEEIQQNLGNIIEKSNKIPDLQNRYNTVTAKM